MNPRNLSRYTSAFFSVLSALLLSVILQATAFGQPVYQEVDGMISFEVEDVLETGSWILMTEHPGYSGSGYYLWDGPNNFNNGGSGTLTYRLNVEHPGDYSIVIHNFHDFPDASEENDVWVRFNEGRWIKIFNHSVDNWNWRSDAEGASRFPGWNTLLKGENSVEISGRSHGFSIDRVHLYLPSLVDHETAQSLEVELTPKSDSPESIQARFVGSPNRGHAPLTVTFDTLLVQVPEGQSDLTIEWDLDDKGAASQASQVEFTYDLPGTYSVSLKVADSSGTESEHTSQITVLAGLGGSLHVHDVMESGHYGGDRPVRILDENPKTRWSNNEPGGWIQFDLGGNLPIDAVLLAFYKGDEKTYTFDIQTSVNGETFTTVLRDGNNTGQTEEYVTYGFGEHLARYVRIVGRGNNIDNFTQITRAQVRGRYARQHWWGNTDQSGDWLFLGEFGYFSLANYPWLYHFNHGWIFSSNIDSESAYLFNLIPGNWTYFTVELFPTFYDFSTEDWKRIFVTSEGVRWLYNYGSGSWLVL